MDNVTHALAGCLLAAATVTLVERRRRADPATTSSPPPAGLRSAATLIGILTAELPDADLLYAGPVLGMGELGYLLHHRGHTHTVLFALAGALLVWAAAIGLRPALREPATRTAMLGLALAGTLSHILLDFTNSYGVHPFWPVDNRWFYGDAVFIVEPWLWIAALPPLLVFSRSTAARVTYALALAAILVAAWLVSMVGRDVAIALTAGAALWLAAVRTAPAPRRIAMGGLCWLAVETVFFGASAAARGVVRDATGTTLRDVVLNPAISNPLCFRALVVETEGSLYRVSPAAVAPFPWLRDVSACGAPGGNSRMVLPSVHTSTPRITWGSEWRAPVQELVAMASGNCEIAAALEFIRVPVWTRSGTGTGTIELSDLRYGEGRGSFASITASERPTTCPAHVPGWIPPRRDIIGVPPARVAR
jgi:inner membrane protein